MVGLQGAGNRRTSLPPPPLAGSRRAPARRPDACPRREARQCRVVAELLAAGRSVVVDNTNPSAAERAPLIAAAREAGVPVQAVWLDTPLDVCLARNARRPEGTRVPLVAVHAAVARFQPPTTAEGFDRVDVLGPSQGPRDATGEGVR
ncbi:ATP-binding protein [Blastococcus goldschmidtiae]|uniref:ATP-binding protein n=1 Tax=Blastococcus goldschmidtiae TaxID=3075546 RepID=A0ABU2K552_9ACTN|nr:ATP-binding protein [Blastococcus sp. DSM 46792]MDT0275319.1 ATP-binding protein [Blastococcus sp. DSM 46792]